MKKRYRACVALLAAVILGGCGATKNAMYQETSASAPAEAAEAPAYDSASASYNGEMEYAEEQASVEYEAAAEEGDSGITATSGIENVGTVSQKLIKRVDMSLETKEFDTLLENVRQKVEEVGGYIEYSDISGNSYYSINSNRNAWLTLRIPADKLDGFVTVVSELGNVTNKNESVEDITLQYVDVESHKKALETEQSRLLELLERAESMEDIISIESRLSQVRYELQSYESTLRTYDNQVSYSTVALNIYEVERILEAPEEKSFWDEVRYRLSDNLYSIGRDLRSFAIWLLSSLPYLLFWAIAIVLVYLVVRRIVKRKPFLGKRKKRGQEEILAENTEQEKK